MIDQIKADTQLSGKLRRALRLMQDIGWKQPLFDNSPFGTELLVAFTRTSCWLTPEHIDACLFSICARHFGDHMTSSTGLIGFSDMPALLREPETQAGQAAVAWLSSRNDRRIICIDQVGNKDWLAICVTSQAEAILSGTLDEATTKWWENHRQALWSRLLGKEITVTQMNEERDNCGHDWMLLPCLRSKNG